jgi:hypothetical protein
VTSQLPGQTRHLNLKDHGRDNTLNSEGYYTLQETVLDQCGAMVAWSGVWRKKKTCSITLPPPRISDSLGFEHGPPP